MRPDIARCEFTDPTGRVCGRFVRSGASRCAWHQGDVAQTARRCGYRIGKQPPCRNLVLPGEQRCRKHDEQAIAGRRHMQEIHRAEIQEADAKRGLKRCAHVRPDGWGCQVRLLASNPRRLCGKHDPDRILRRQHWTRPQKDALLEQLDRQIAARQADLESIGQLHLEARQRLERTQLELADASYTLAQRQGSTSSSATSSTSSTVTIAPEAGPLQGVLVALGAIERHLGTLPQPFARADADLAIRWAQAMTAAHAELRLRRLDERTRSASSPALNGSRPHTA